MIYLFYGPDDFQRNRALQALKSAIPPEVADLNITVLEGRKLRLDDVQTACEAYPFLAERRLVIVYHGLKYLRAAEERDALKEYLSRVPATVDLVFVEAEDPDQRTALFKELQRRAEVRIFNPLEGEALQQWLIDQARELGVSLAPAAARMLAENAGSDGWTLWNELQKLATYVGPGGTITAAEIQLLVVDESESNLFAFIDMLFSRQRSTAPGPGFDRLRDLLSGGEAPHYILFMLARQVRLLLAVQSAGRSSPDQLARSLGQRPFVVRKVQEQARGFRPAELRELHNRLVELDQAVKTGRIDALVALDLFVGTLVFEHESAGR